MVKPFRRAVLALLLAAAAAPAARAADRPVDPPEILFQDLFVTASTTHALEDDKLLVDAIPLEDPAEILRLYHSEKPQSPEALKAFVGKHFRAPPAPPAPAIAEGLPLADHITALWQGLTRQPVEAPANSSLLFLPHPYVVPGGVFTEIYYWDSYFTMLGLLESGRRDLAEDMLKNFTYLIDSYGHIPNGNRTYYLSRSQPPFFYAMVGLLSQDDPAAGFARYLPQLKAEYAFWMDGAEGLAPGTAHRRVVALKDGAILNRYWDDRDMPRDEDYPKDVELAEIAKRPAAPLFRDIRAAAESGWDFSSRWFADAKSMRTIVTTEILPVDLNSLMYGLETAIGQGCRRQGDEACATLFARRAAARRAAMDNHLWNESGGAYFDYRWTKGKSIPDLSAATLFPLFTSAATPRQAKAVARTVEKRLLKPGGVVTTLNQTGQQWDWPNGWAPLQWIAIDGFRSHGEEALAKTIACRWVGQVRQLYGKTGKLFEKYDVVQIDRPGGGGEYPLQDGFGWTNGVTMKLMTLYPEESCRG